MWLQRTVQKTIGSRFAWIPLFFLLGCLLGGLISIPMIPEPDIAIITISGVIFDQANVDDILNELRSYKNDNSIRAVVLQIDSPGGSVVAIEPIYLEVLELKKNKPVVTTVAQIAASGGYYIAAASDFIYALPSSSVGSIGVIGTLPTPEELDEDVITSGPFKAIGGSRRKSVSEIATIKQHFIEAILSQRGARLNMSEGQLSRAEVYSGTESLGYGLIDDIGTRSSAMRKAAQLAHLRSYGVLECLVECPPDAELIELKSPMNNVPIYFYLYVELE